MITTRNNRHRRFLKLKGLTNNVAEHIVFQSLAHGKGALMLIRLRFYVGNKTGLGLKRRTRQMVQQYRVT